MKYCERNPEEPRSGPVKIRSPKIFRYLVVLLFILPVLAYVNSLNNGFVWDDDSQVLNNPFIKNLHFIPEIFSRDAWGGGAHPLSNYYRPLMNIIFMLDYHLFGFRAWGFHLVNILINALVAILIFLLIRRLFEESGPSGSNLYLLPSFIAALLFAVHPIHTEAVTWISGVPEISFALFYLLALYFFILGNKDPGFNSFKLISVVSFFVSALCKETALTLPLVLLGYDSAFGQPFKNMPGCFRKYMPYLGAAAIYFILRFRALGGLVPHARRLGFNAYQYVLTAFFLFGQYVEKLITPLNLRIFYVFHPVTSIFAVRGFLSMLIVFIFLFLDIVAWKKNKMVFFGLFFFSATLLPVLYIPGLGNSVFAERYLYLPSFGGALLVAAVLAWSRTILPKTGTALTVISTLLLASYSLMTISRNTVWKDEVTLYSDTMKKTPEASLIGNDLGILYMEKGQDEKALELFNKAIVFNPSFSEVYYNRSIVLMRKGQMDEALTDLNKAIALNPAYTDAYHNRGIVFMYKGQMDGALNDLDKAIALNPAYAEAYLDRGIVFSQKRQMDLALKDFNTSISLGPANAMAYYDRGTFYLGKGDIKPALADMGKACSLGNQQGCNFLKRHM